jgi:hypothetical protein
MIGIVAASFLIHFIYKYFKSDKPSLPPSSNIEIKSSNSGSSSGSGPDGGIPNSTAKAASAKPNAVAVTAPTASTATAVAKPNAVAVTASAASSIPQSGSNNLKFPEVSTHNIKISTPLPKQVNNTRGVVPVE